MKSGFFSRICSYLFPWLVEQRVGGISPFLEVWLIDGKYQLNTKKANYSFGNLHTVFASVFKKRNIAQQIVNEVLVLGFGSGSVASILQEEQGIVCAITAVEKDPVVIELGHTYFDIDRFKHLKLICDDALSFVQNDHGSYDLIVVDLFIDLDVPPGFYDEKFLFALHRLLKENGFLYFNSIPYSAALEDQVNVLEQRMRLIFRQVEIEKLTIEGTGNWVFVCTK